MHCLPSYPQPPMLVLHPNHAHPNHHHTHRIYKGRYGGYAGEASPEKVAELLSADDNIFLVDIRPEETREKEGLPQLKLAARYKVAAFPLQVCALEVEQQG